MFSKRIRDEIRFGATIPKPNAKAAFKVKGWGTRRGSPALIYTIPNHKNSAKPYEKGITEDEFEVAYGELRSSGEFTREWFNQHMTSCAKEGGCNFTTIGGIFELLKVARYSKRGVYVRSSFLSATV
jgi:hypothetical protein